MTILLRWRVDRIHRYRPREVAHSQIYYTPFSVCFVLVKLEYQITPRDECIVERNKSREERQNKKKKRNSSNNKMKCDPKSD